MGHYQQLATYYHIACFFNNGNHFGTNSQTLLRLYRPRFQPVKSYFRLDYSAYCHSTNIPNYVGCCRNYFWTISFLLEFHKKNALTNEYKIQVTPFKN